MKSFFFKLLFQASALTFVVSCVESPGVKIDGEVLVDSVDRFEKSTTAGNLLATALKKEYDLDIALIPSEALRSNSFALIEPGMDAEKVSKRVMSLVDSRYRIYKIGTMKGGAVKRFILERSVEMLRHDLHVAGIQYDVLIEGGIPKFYQFNMEDGSEIDEDRYYRIAVDVKNYRSFPGYWFRHNLSRTFRWEKEEADLGVATSQYLETVSNFAAFNDTRSRVRLSRKSQISGVLPVSVVQGPSHMSPLLGHQVTVEGVVTVEGTADDGFHKGRLEAYIQAPVPDNDPRTSEGLFVEFSGLPELELSKGDLIRVTGIVYEDVVNEGLTRTGIREIDKVEIIQRDVALPESIMLGKSGTTIPSKVISSYRGNVNQKDSLNLEDGLDFWESLEGMRIRVETPTVVGFAGGKKDYNPRGAKSYLNVFITAEGTESTEQKTPAGGLMIDNIEFDYNPEIIRITDHHLAPDVKTSKVFEIGNKFPYDLEGVFAYNKNLFGGGEYVLYMTGEFESLAQTKELTEKPRTALMPAPNKLTVATFNVENLSAGDKDYRFDRIGQSISYNLRCPDIVNLVEIQDNMGAFDTVVDVESGNNTDASETLNRLIAEIEDCPHPAEYAFVNVDPIENQEGGEPGGNIRVAMIYNTKRVSFKPRGESRSIDETYIAGDGSLALNPGRVGASDARLRGTRKPLAVEFEFMGEKVFIIGNHFNSKGGDTSLWSAVQPPVMGSEVRRSQIAQAVNDFVASILFKSPRANVIVTGDFNDFNESRALVTLEGRQLKNLANVIGENGLPLIEPNNQYTYNYGGNSQPLDFILVSDKLLGMNPKVEALHINTDYMWQVADHDPVISQYTFESKSED